MKLFAYAFIMRACDALCALLHRCERLVQRLRVWAWVRASQENLRSCSTRATSKTILS